MLLVVGAALALVHQGIAYAERELHTLPECENRLIWTNPNPGTCVTVSVMLSMAYPDGHVVLTTQGQDSDPEKEPYEIKQGETKVFHTKYDEIWAHEIMVPISHVIVTW